MIQKFLLKKLFRLVRAEEIRETLPRHAFIFPSAFATATSANDATNPQSICQPRVEVEAKRGEEGEGDDEDGDEEEEEEEGGEVGDLEEEDNEIQRLDEYWIDSNPLAELSERELICEVDWRRVKRCVLVRCD
jgi:hypothetical protein